MKSQHLVVLTFLATLVGPAPAGAASNKVAFLHDTAFSYALRAELFDKAERTIDLSMYHQGGDPTVGAALALKLRQAALRGVRVRMVTSFFAADHSDKKRVVHALLNDPALGDRSRLVTYGAWLQTPIPSKFAKIWNTFDEKLIVIDGRIAILGGRGHSEEYLRWIDTDLWLEGPAVAELSEAFEAIWKRANLDFGASARPDLGRKAQAIRATAFELDSRIVQALPSARGWLAGGPVGATPSAPELFELPEASRIVVHHHRLIDKLHAGPSKGDFVKLQDPVLESFLTAARTSRRIWYTSLYPRIETEARGDNRLYEALRAATASGSDVRLLTNTLEGSKDLDSNPWPYLSGVPSLRAMTAAGVRIARWKKDLDLSPITFVHQKVAIFEDRVLIGSHNFNWPSTHAYDQLSVEIIDPAVTASLASSWIRNWQEAVEATLADWDLELRKHRFGIWSSRFLLGPY